LNKWCSREVLDRACPTRRDGDQVFHRELDVLPLLRCVAVLAAMTTLRRQGRAQPAAALSRQAEAGQVIVFSRRAPT
jgi:hypothetical protein